jgi:hypothetical protein
VLDKFGVGKLRKGKVVMVLLIAVLVLASLNIFAPVLVQPSSVDKATCFSSLVSAQSVQPSVTRTEFKREGDYRQTTVAGAFINNEDVEVYGVATAVVNIRPGESKTLSSERTLLLPHEAKWITINFPGLQYEQSYAIFMTFTAEPIAAPTGSGTLPTFPGSTPHRTTSASGGFDFASIGVPIIGVAAVAVCSVAGFVMLKKMRLSEQKVKRFTSYEYQDWVVRRLGGHAGSVLDSRKGIDGFTSDNVPVSIKQSDSVDRLQVDSFMSALTQLKVRSGVIVAFGFNSDANVAVSRARMNRFDIKLVTIKELIERKEMIL